MAGVNNVESNTAIYTAAGAGTGAVVGGAGAYYLTKAIKDNKATDKFVKAAAEGLEGDAKTALENLTKEAVKPELTTYLNDLKDATKTAVPTEAEALKGFKQGIVDKLKTLGIEGESVTKGLESVNNAETLKAFAESTSSQATHNARSGAINGLIKDGKFVTEGANKTLGEGLQKFASKFRTKAALIWAPIIAAVGAIAAYVMTKKDS